MKNPLTKESKTREEHEHIIKNLHGYDFPGSKPHSERKHEHIIKTYMGMIVRAQNPIRKSRGSDSFSGLFHVRQEAVQHIFNEIGCCVQGLHF